MKKQVLILYYAFKDARTPWYAKLVTVSAILYLLSPVDLVPDIIPVAGYLDDLVVVPLLMGLAGRLLPLSVKEAAQQKVRDHGKRFKWVIIGVAIAAIIGLMFLFYHLYQKHQLAY